MRIIEKAGEMQQQAELWRQKGNRIVFVPTMGYLHQGHLELLRHARRVGDIVVLSIFVNPAQFGPAEDLERYPRNLERDKKLAEGAGVDVIFAPKAEDMYPSGYQTYLEVINITQFLCGQSRPGHFRGVATVVAKLFNIVKPHAAVFGEKDFQQLVVVKRMACDLNIDVEVIGHPIVREADGLAMSSRNVYLTPEQRRDALRLSKSLHEAQALVARGEDRSEAIIHRVREILEKDRGVRIDYVQIREPENLNEVTHVKAPTLLAIAAYVGVTRLIDNCILSPPS